MRDLEKLIESLSSMIRSGEAADELKAMRKKMEKELKMDRQEIIADCIENNAHFRNLPIWKENLDEKWQKIRRVINIVGQLQETLLLEDMESDPRVTHTVEQLFFRRDAQKAISRMISELMSYASKMGVVDGTPFKEWEKERGENKTWENTNLGK